VFGRERPVADLAAGDFDRLPAVTDHVRNWLFAETVAAKMGRGLILSRSKNGWQPGHNASRETLAEIIRRYRFSWLVPRRVASRLLSLLPRRVASRLLSVVRFQTAMGSTWAALVPEVFDRVLSGLS